MTNWWRYLRRRLYKREELTLHNPKRLESSCTSFCFDLYCAHFFIESLT